MSAAQPKVRNTVVRSVCRELQAARADTAKLLKAAGLSKAQAANDDGWVPYEAHAALLELAATELKDPYFGLNIAQRINAREFGALAYVGLASATLEDALRNLERYVHVQNEAWHLEFSISSEVATLSGKPSHDDYAHFVQATEAAVGLLLNSYRHYTGKQLKPVEIDFVHGLGASRSQAHLEELLGCPAKFGRNRIEMKLRAADLQRPIITADDRLLEVLRAHCASVLRDKGLPMSDLSTLVRKGIADGLSKGRAKARIVAADLGMTERSLHRKLAAENTSFGDILDEIRRRLAAQYLREAKLSTKQIAFLLGYADQSSFGTAHRRWTGLTPKAARAGQD